MVHQRAIYIIVICCGFSAYQARAQCTDFSFPSVDDSLCLGEELYLSEETYNNIRWTFCEGNFDNPDIPQTIIDDLGTNGRVYGIEILKIDENYYGFFVSRANQLFRINFGEAIDEDYSIDELTPIGMDLLNEPINLKLIKTSSHLMGFITNLGNQKLLHIDFGDPLNDSPVIEIFTDLGYSVFDVEVQQIGSYYYLFTSAFNSNIIKQYKVNANDLTIEGSSEIQISGGSDFRYLTSQLKCDSLYLFPSDFTTGNIFRVKLDANYDAIAKTDIVATITRPLDLFFPALYTQSILLVQTRDGEFYKIDFESDIESATSSTELEDAHINRSDVFGIAGFVGIDSLEWSLLTLESVRQELYKINFSETCNASKPYSSEHNTSVHFNEPGDYDVGLTVFDNNSPSTRIGSLTVTTNQAPDISIAIDESRCVASENAFSAVNTSGDISGYSWDFNNDGVSDSSDPDPLHEFGATGLHTVRLEVESMAGCSNYVEKEVRIYPEPPVPSFQVEAAHFCVGSEIWMNNQTDTSVYDGLVNFHWSATGRSDTTHAGPSFAFDAPGEKIISVYASIPGCESEVTKDTITIVAAPDIDFLAPAVCHGEFTAFTGITTTDQLTYHWDFGDGIISTLQDPEHLYDDPGTYHAVLSVADTNGCESQVAHEAVISPIPEPGFEYAVICENSEATLTDVSIVEEADIVGWEWYLDEELVSVAQSPGVMFGEAGHPVVTLRVTASNGCKASVSESVEVLTQPRVDFNVDVGCIGEASGFTDLTTNVRDIRSWQWTIDGKVYHEQHIAHTFDAPGQYEVELLVTNENFCTGSAKKLIDVLSLPELAFEVTGQCENEPITVKDQTIDSSGSIVSRTWLLDGEAVGNGLQALMPVEEAGAYTLSLKVLTESGCETVLHKPIEVESKPEAAFLAQNDYGVPPFTLAFTNQSSNATYYEWYLDGQLVTSEKSPVLLFQNEADYKVKLVAGNAEGCIDSADLTVTSVYPQIDLSINSMQLQHTDGTARIILNIGNYSNLPIELMEASISLENRFSVAEQILKRIDPGQETVITLNTAIPLTSNDLGYLCVSVTSAYQETDAVPGNNERCINLEEEAVVEPPYPNPAQDIVKVKAIIPENGEVIMSILDVSGQIKFRKTLSDIPAGLNIFTLDLLKLNPGTYFIGLKYKGRFYNARVVKQ